MSLPKKKSIEYVDFFREYKAAQRDGRLVDESKLKEKYNSLLKLKKSKPGDSEVYNALGMVSCLLGKKEETSRYHKAAITMNNNPDYYHNFAISLVAFDNSTVKEVKEAMEYTQQAIKMNPSELIYHINYLNILEIQGKIKEAKPYIQELLSRQFPENETLIELLEDFEDYDQIEIASNRASDPKTKYIPIEKVIADLEIQNQHS